MGYRRGRYRGATKLAVGLGVVGILASLAGAWFVSLGPAADRGALPYFLIGGPAVSIALAAAVLLVRYLLRRASGRTGTIRNLPGSPKAAPPRWFGTG